MSIPEEMIMNRLDDLLTSSEASAVLHHLDVVSAPQDAVGPLGLAAEEQLEFTRAAIAPVFPYSSQGNIGTDEFIMKSIGGVGLDHQRRGHLILFAAISQEMWHVDREHFDDRARELLKKGRLGEHPDSVEETIVYAAARDGRRWRGRRRLTGPKAGQTEAVDLLVGEPTRQEVFGLPFAPVLRRLVGLRR